MSEPSIEPGILAKAVDWLWAGVVALVGIVYRTGEEKHKKAMDSIKTLFENAENDRALTRDLHEKQMNKINEVERDMMKTMSLNQADIIKAISEINKNP